MAKINLHTFDYFRDEQKLSILNRLVKISNNLMPHQVAVATGCDLVDALGILLILQSRSLAEGFLLVYHDQEEPPSMVRRLAEGLPRLPLVCDVCGEEIQVRESLSYDFLFEHSKDLEFVSE